MNKEVLNDLIKRVNLYFDYQFEKGFNSYELCASKKHIEEHKYCYSIDWLLKSEINIKPSKRTLFAGGGPILVSKISDDIEMTGSSPFVDFVKEFELKIRGLEGYWNLEIEFDKSKLSTLKILLNLNTPELLKKVGINSKINIAGEEYELDILMKDLTNASINCVLELKERERTENI